MNYTKSMSSDHFSVTNTETLAQWKKIDFWGTIVLITSAIFFLRLFTIFDAVLVMVFLPDAVMLHSPILEVKDFSTTNDKDVGVICNPLYQKIIRNWDLYHKEIQNSSELTSTTFLSDPETLAVADNHKQQLGATNKTEVPVTKLGFGLWKVCSAYGTANTTYLCKTYQKIKEDCYSGVEEQERFNAEWGFFQTCQIAFILSFAFLTISLILTVISMFDPPIIRLEPLARVEFISFFFYLSGIFATISYIFFYTKYIWYKQMIVELDVPEAYLTTRFYRFIVASAPNTVFGAVYIFLYFRAPKYPRNKSRIVTRGDVLLRKIQNVGERNYI